MNSVKLQLARTCLVALLLTISYLAFMPSDTSILDTGFDKTNHFLAFFVLAMFFQFSFPDRSLIYFIFLPLLAYAVFIEVVQYFLPYRTFSLLDIIADLLAVIVYLLLLRYYHQRVRVRVKVSS